MTNTEAEHYAGSSAITIDDKLAASVVAGLRTQVSPSESNSSSALTTTAPEQLPVVRTKRMASANEDVEAVAVSSSSQDHHDSKSMKKNELTNVNAASPAKPSYLYPTFPPACTPYAAEFSSTEDVDESLSSRELLPAPYFYYRDHSTKEDDDPLTPLTPLARVPNFPAKMHAILSRKDLADVITWLPHGRAWRVLKPREFEVRVIPTYFEHNKFSSFIRQANGWGFRRVTKGPDRNSYYHELFLRGIPHVSKGMKRPGPSKKATVDPDHEPDFYKISEEWPVPEKVTLSDDMIMLPSTLMGGPKARMPVGGGGGDTTAAAMNSAMSVPTARYPFPLPSTSTASTSFKNPTHTNFHVPFHNPMSMISQFSMPPPSTTTTMTNTNTTNHHPFTPSQEQVAAVHQALSSLATQMGNDPTSQFAAGFAAAAALTHSNFQLALSQALEMSRASTTSTNTNIDTAAALVMSGTTTMGMMPSTSLPMALHRSHVNEEEPKMQLPN